MKLFWGVKLSLLIITSCLFLNQSVQATSDLLGYTSDGKLNYISDAKGNRIPDFSYVGYHHSEKAIPNVPVKRTLNPSAGTADDYQMLQNAIDYLEGLTPDANGYRGTLLLNAGSYRTSNTLYVRKSGIVIRGQGTSTVLRYKKQTQSSCIVFTGSSNYVMLESSKKKITDNFVPIGAQTVTVEAGHSFAVGDRIIVERAPKQAWIKLLGMDILSDLEPGDSDWTTDAYTIQYQRKVVRVNGNKITIDAPIVDLIDPVYATGYVYKYTWDGRIEEVGIENMEIQSYAASDTDENHGWEAVVFNQVENGWMRNIDTYKFGYSCVTINSNSSKITVLNCRFLDPASEIVSSRRYSFNVDGQQNLIKDCYASEGRHDFVTGAQVAGPNVFYNCVAENSNAPTGPHHRWASGILFDNVVNLTQTMSAENRLNSGSGHGWAANSTMYWNCKAALFVVQNPPGYHRNWVIGCIGPVTNKDKYPVNEELAYVESNGTHLDPGSLFETQLNDRLSGGLTQQISGKIEAEDYVQTYGFGTTPTQDNGGGLNTRMASLGDWLEYQVNVTEPGTYEVKYRVASLNNTEFSLSIDGTILDNLNTSGTGGWQNWKTVSKTIEIPKSGIQVLKIESTTTSSWNMNWIEFTKGSSNLNGIYQLINVATGNYLDSDGGGAVKVESSGNGDDKKWILHNIANDYYNIDCQYSGRGVLDSDGGGKVIYNTIESPATSADKQWKAIDLGNNIYRFQNKFDGRDYLSVNTTTNVVGYSSSTGNDTKWELVLVSKSATIQETDQFGSELTLYPNPATNWVYLDFATSNIHKIEFYNLRGQKVYEEKVFSKTFKTSTNNIGSPGIYIVKMIKNDGYNISKKLVIN